MPAADQLEWVLAQHSDTRALNRFVCTEPERTVYDRHRGRHHPRPWELETQSALRGLRLPRPVSEALVIHRAGVDIAAACHFGYDRREDQFFVWTVATALSHRRQGLGRAALAAALHVLASTQAEHASDCAVFTRIHPQNLASRTLFESVGFTDLGVVFGGYESWVLMNLPTGAVGRVEAS